LRTPAYTSPSRAGHPERGRPANPAARSGDEDRRH
jgi:hypothetical protein